ncbi:hypothetical protein SAMN04489842_4131 [Natronobacterium texcoconense]|uniref:Uncharacterized protein n=1 Tax=Natronobacterium texcoconense TaxID=1095778 RepID=A0A1H1J4T2_NATTX|nr:hypothetical protein SAMN04489842_4131 [Natronobacterium texcoconense]
MLPFLFAKSGSAERDDLFLRIYLGILPIDNCNRLANEIREIEIRYELVEEGKFGSRSEALRYGARLVAREEQQKRIHERTTDAAEQDIEDRLERKRVCCPSIDLGNCLGERSR